jgi:hypothetical protein
LPGLDVPGRIAFQTPYFLYRTPALLRLQRDGLLRVSRRRLEISPVYALQRLQNNPFSFLKDPLIDLDVENQTSLEKITLLEDLIHDYAQRVLSRDEDSLNAVSALLQYMQRVIFPDSFLCGLPLADFRNSILWHGNQSSRILLDGPTAARRSSANIPSWSWAAWNLNNRITFARSSRFLDAWVKLTIEPSSENCQLR